MNRRFLQRIYGLILKEIITLFRDPKGRFVLIIPPLLQLFIFAFAATLDIKEAHIAILNQDNGHEGEEIISYIEGSPIFKQSIIIKSQSQIAPLIETQKVIAAFIIPDDFSKNIYARQLATVQIILDGRRSNAAQIIEGYIRMAIGQYSQAYSTSRGVNRLSVNIINRHWYNDNLNYLWFSVPSLVCILSMLIALIITALSVARERELGTFEQLLVSPLLPYEILLGKTIPAIMIGLIEGCFMWAAAVFLFQIPFYGSIGLMFLTLTTFIISIIGIGLFISAISHTQQQAILGTFMFMVPAVTLSGYASPIENMPLWLQKLSWFNPLTHCLIIVRGLFLKNITAHHVLSHLWPLWIITLITLPLAAWYFNRRMN